MVLVSPALVPLVLVPRSRRRGAGSDGAAPCDPATAWGPAAAVLTPAGEVTAPLDLAELDDPAPVGTGDEEIAGDPGPASPAPDAVRPRRVRSARRVLTLDVPLTVLACLGALVAVGLGRPELDAPATASGTASVTGADPRDPHGSSPDPSPPAPTVAVGAPLVPPIELPGLVSHTAAPGRTVALTFDDGPDPSWTPQVLDLLARYRVHATFCVVGQMADAHPGLVARIRAEGHQLCDHTRSHDAHLAHAPADRVREEVLGGRDHILAAAGPGSVVGWFRAPEGAWSPAVLGSAADGGMTPLSWSVDTLDWTRPGVPAILAAIRRELRPGGVILMHDGGGPREQSVEALAALLPWLQGQGWTVVGPAPVAPPENRS